VVLGSISYNNDFETSLLQFDTWVKDGAKYSTHELFNKYIKTMKRIVIKKSTDKQYYFTVVAANNKVLVTSETYTTKAVCLKGINALIKFFDSTRDFEIIDQTQ